MNRSSIYRQEDRNKRVIANDDLQTVLFEVFDFLRLSDVKTVRLVCRQWYLAARNHIQNRGQLNLDSGQQGKFKEFALSKKSAGYYPTKNLKLAISECFGCECKVCRPFDGPTKNFENEHGLNIIIGNCTSGIKNFTLVLREFRSTLNMPANHRSINVEKILLREEFQILSELHINAPFKLTKNSGINSVLRKLTALQLGYLCSNESFSENVFKECRLLKSLTIGFADETGFFVKPAVKNGIGGIFDALRIAQTENTHLAVQELTIVSKLIDPWFTTNVENTNIFTKIRNLNLNLKFLQLQFQLKIIANEVNKPRNEILLNEIQALLESQKNSLVNVALPTIWSTSQQELKHFPEMKNLRHLQTNLNVKLPMIDLEEKLPVLKTLNIKFTDTAFKHLFTREIPVFNGSSEFSNHLTQNIIPCETLKEMNLDFSPNAEMLTGLSRVFPNVQFLTLQLACENLQALWGKWPRLRELTLMVKDVCGKAEKLSEATFYSEPAKFHAGLIGMPVNDCEALIESSVSFLSLKMENFHYDLPSIRDLTELKKLTLDSDVACNLVLMLGIFPMKNLQEVCIKDSEMTIECVLHLLKCCPNIQTWEFSGICCLDYNFGYRSVYPCEIISWTISSRNTFKLKPTYDQKWISLRGTHKVNITDADPKDKLRLRSIRNYGKGKCLFWTPHYDPPSFYIY